MDWLVKKRQEKNKRLVILISIFIRGEVVEKVLRIKRKLNCVFRLFYARI